MARGAHILAAVLAAIVACAAAAAPAFAAPQQPQADLGITNTASTSADACMARRGVVLRRAGKGVRSYGRATTRADGSYAITTRRSLRGRLYVAVAARTAAGYRCRAGRSPLR